jgi:hypothetical protein
MFLYCAYEFISPRTIIIRGTKHVRSIVGKPSGSSGGYDEGEMAKIRFGQRQFRTMAISRPDDSYRAIIKKILSAG